MRKIRLTKKRAKWVAPRKKVTIEGTRLAYNAGPYTRYKKSLDALIGKMTRETNRRILKLFSSETAKDFFVVQDENLASQARILTNELIEKFTSLFKNQAKPIAERAVSQSDKVSKTALHRSLKKMSGGASIKTDFITADMSTILKAAVTENMALIKSVSSDYLSRVQKSVMRNITSEQGLSSLQKDLLKYDGISERKAKMIARDQTRKVYNQLNAKRMEAVNVDKFVWIHSGGGLKPRQEHVEMNGKIYSLSDPPVIDSNTGERGLPGQLANCGCTMTPVIEFNTGEAEE